MKLRRVASVLLCTTAFVVAFQAVPAFALTVSHRVTHLESRMKAAEKKLNPLPSGVAGLKSTVGLHTQTIASLVASMAAAQATSGTPAAFDARVDAVETSVTALGRRTGVLESLMATLQSVVDSLASRLGLLEAGSGGAATPPGHFAFGAHRTPNVTVDISNASRWTYMMFETYESPLVTVTVGAAVNSSRLQDPHIMVHLPSGDRYGSGQLTMKEADLPPQGTVVEYDVYAIYMNQNAHWHDSFVMPALIYSNGL
jgi:uncharacterized coiled-coil protein SlyX